MQEINYQTHYRKGFHEDQENWQKFVDCRLTGDSHDIYCAVNGLKKDRLPVDACVFGTYFKDEDLWNKHKAVPYDVGSEEHLKELDFIRELSKNRDEKISDQGYDIDGLNEVSYFLRDYEVPIFDSVDYLTKEEDLAHVYRGFKPVLEQKFKPGTKKIETLRDAAAYVRNDPAVGIWIKVANELLAEKVAFRNEVFIRDFKEGSQFSFSVLSGGIDIEYLYREAAYRVSRGSFRNKWLNMFPRPEQAAWDLDQELISMAYDRGAPYHSSFSAMHSAIYNCLMTLTLSLFDGSHIMKNGKTVEYNSRILFENGAHWRCVAGVHYMQDNLAIIPFSSAVANRVVNEKLKETQSVICKKRY